MFRILPLDSNRAGQVDQSEFEQIVRIVTEEVVRYLGALRKIRGCRRHAQATMKFAPIAI